MAPSPYIFIISIGPVDMNKYARFDEIPSKTLKDIKETKCYGRTYGWTDNVKTVYPPTNTVCGGGGGGGGGDKKNGGNPNIWLTHLI